MCDDSSGLDASRSLHRQPRCVVHAPSVPAPQQQHIVTMVTQVSLDRWPKLCQLAAAWGGPLSVAGGVAALWVRTE